MWYGILARHRQDACATSFIYEMETLYMSEIHSNPDSEKRYYKRFNLFPKKSNI
ncbi:MAG: hypothetical protein RLZZ338_4771 [Cyanobacteriota bacterium]|jgi:hypothetical protein